MLSNAFQAITITESWEFMKKAIESYSFSEHPQINIIYKKMEELGYYGHSGFTFGWTMRQMQVIARYGEKEYMLSKLSEQNKK